MAFGKVMVNNPMGANELIVQGSVTGQAANTTHFVWVRDLRYNGAPTVVDGPWLFTHNPNGYVKLVTFVSDELGNGSFNYHLPAGTLNDGTYNIQVAINKGEPIGISVLATPWAAGADGLTVVIKSAQ